MEDLTGKRVHQETGSPFDATLVKDVGQPPRIHSAETRAPELAAFARGAGRGGRGSGGGGGGGGSSSSAYLKARSGSGGAASTALRALVGAPLQAHSAAAPRLTLLLPPASTGGGGSGGSGGAGASPTAQLGPPAGHSREQRPNPPNSAFRRA